MVEMTKPNDATYWRKRALDARSFARSISDLDTRRILEGIADSYEQLANSADRRASLQ